eukprot:g2339.t1
MSKIIPDTASPATAARYAFADSGSGMPLPKKRDPKQVRAERIFAVKRFFHFLHLGMITSAMAALDFDDPVLLGALGFGAVALAAFPAGHESGAAAAVVVVLFALLAIGGVAYTIRKIGRMEHYAARFGAIFAKLQERGEDKLGPASSVATEDGGPPPPRQHDRCGDLDTLMARAAELGPQFLAEVLEPLRAKASAVAGREATCSGFNLKGEQRSREKTASDYGGDFCRLLDLLRGSIVCEEIDDVVACFEKIAELEAEGVLRVQRIKNRFRDGGIEGSGYCDANLNVEFAEHICEVQVQLKAFYQDKKHAHGAYKIARSLDLEGGLREIPKGTPLGWGQRALVTGMLLAALGAALYQWVIYRFYQWFLCIVLQATTKLPQLGSAAWSAGATQEAVRVPPDGDKSTEALLETWFFVVLGALVFNALYPVVLLCIPVVERRRNMAMAADAMFDLIYGPVSVALIDSVVGPAAAPSAPWRFFSNLYPAFHVFTLACGIETGALQRSAAARRAASAAVGQSRRGSMETRMEAVKVGNAGYVPRWAAALFLTAALGVIGFAVSVGCSDRFPLADAAASPCRPCVCDPDTDALYSYRIVGCAPAAGSFPSLLRLRDRNITEVSTGAFEDAAYPILRNVDLKYNKLESCSSLPTELQVLDVSGNQIGDEGAAALAGALEGKLSLTTLHIHTNQIGSNGTSALAAGLKDKAAFETVYIYLNQIGDEGLVALAGALEGKTKLLTLGMDGNGFGDMGVVALAGAFKDMAPVPSLYLSYNQIGSEGTAALAETWRDKTELTIVSLGANKIGNAGAVALAVALENKRTLTYLYLYSNQIGDAGVVALAEGLKRDKKRVATVELYDNQIGNEGAAALAVALKDMPALRFVHLHGNQIGDEGALAVANALRLSQNLEELKLQGNIIGNATKANVRELLKDAGNNLVLTL